ncbi:MAG: sn-glycerol-1-phosphate dehydrogenase, partial [Oscillospiraceae bacterium]
MIKPDQFKIADYLNTTFSCSCGKEHSISLKQVELSAGAINKLPTIIQQYGYQKVCVICDTNTYEVAGKKVMGILSQSNIQAKHYMFRSTALVPDEAACGTILSNIDEGTDLIIAVGSGTINDLCKFISYKVGLKYFIVATAPSMDGFASIGAPLIIDKLKVTYDTHSPQVIIGDLDVLCCAPMDMITAGLGDILGKYTCLIDWKIAHIINDEYYCETIVQMVEHSISKVINNASLVKSRDPKVIADIMEALVLTGIAMGFVENSRPASGSEHHISHFWEMRFLFESKPPVPHGTKVGIGTIAILYLYHELKNMQIDFRKANSAAFLFDYEAWENRIKNTYGQAATGVI